MHTPFTETLAQIVIAQRIATARQNDLSASATPSLTPRRSGRSLRRVSGSASTVLRAVGLI